MNKPHAPLLFAVRDGVLHIGGTPVPELAARYSTPLYAYDAALIVQRVSELRAVLPAQMDLHYAIKANPFPPLLARMAGWVDGADVASKGELAAAMHAGFHPAKLSFAGPAKRDEELCAALHAGLTINLESAGELERCLQLGKQIGARPRVALRINPPFELKGSGMRMGGGAKPFGIDAEAALPLLQQLPSLDVDFQGLHIYAGSQSLQAEAIVQAQRASLELARDLLHAAGLSCAHINLGGGWGIPYFPGEQRLDHAQLGVELHALIGQHAAWLDDTRLILELGRYVVGEAGAYITRVIERKTSRGETFLLCDGGMHQHLALSGNLGQVIRKNYPLYLAHRADAPPEEIVQIHGPLCTPLDVLGQNVALPAVQVGDLLVITQSGAYGASASPINFLSHPPPAEVLL